MDSQNKQPVFTIAPGAGGLPRLDLVAPGGARASIYLHGAHVTSWVPEDGRERLFLSRAAHFKPGAPIRGGIPVIFPQFGALGSLVSHGLARRVSWEFAGAQVEGERAVAAFRLRDSEESRSQWPHSFLAELLVSVGGSQLEAALSVTNTGHDPFSFTAALHTYFSVDDIAAASVRGLAGLRYRDSAAGGIEKLEEAAQVVFSGEVDRIYFNAPPETLLVEPGRAMAVRMAGFADTVVWNPAAQRCAAIPDLEPGDYRRFVCIEAAAVGKPVPLAPGETWKGAQILSI